MLARTPNADEYVMAGTRATRCWYSQSMSALSWYPPISGNQDLPAAGTGGLSERWSAVRVCTSDLPVHPSPGQTKANYSESLFQQLTVEKKIREIE